MSHEPCDPEDTPPGEKSPNSTTTTQAKGPLKGVRSKKTNWGKVRVFKEPEYRVPFTFSKYKKGKRGKHYGEPELWLQVAVESGLVAMGSPLKDGRVADWYEPIGDHPPGWMSHEELEALIAKGIADLLEKK